MTKDETTATELAWEHATHDIPEAGLSRKRAAEPEELAAVARALELIACSRLEAEYTVIPSLDGHYHVSGTLRAEVSQSCVVTLEPITSTIEEPFDVTFWPAGDMPAPASGEVSLDEEPDPEPIVDDQIAVGRIVFECLAAAIDPFPRKPDAALDRTSTAPEDSTGKPDSPFAVLASIRRKS